MSNSPDRDTAATVTNIGPKSGYFRNLASGQITSAREKLRLDQAGFADYLSDALGWRVMPGAVANWEEGATPPTDVYLAAAVAAQEIPGDVLSLPLDAAAGRRAALMSAIGPAIDHSSSEHVTSYADRGLVTRQQWNDIIRGAQHHLWLYGMAELGYAEDDEVPSIMEEAAARGCKVRVLLLDPAYPGIADIDREEGRPPGTLAARIRAAVASFSQIREACGGGMQLRAYNDHPAVSIVRGDDEMLFTPYIRACRGDNTPTFEIGADTEPKMFGRYARHFASTWDVAKECG